MAWNTDAISFIKLAVSNHCEGQNHHTDRYVTGATTDCGGLQLHVAVASKTLTLRWILWLAFYCGNTVLREHW